MAKYYPYVVLETNVKTSLLKYRLYVYNTVTNKAETSILFTSKEFKKVGNNLYQTRSAEIDDNKLGIESIRDCVIILDLYRLSISGKKALVLSNYIVPDKIESYTSANFSQNTNISKVQYNEANYVTKVIKDNNSKNTFQLNLSRERIFQCIDPGCKPGEAKDPFSKIQIEAGLQARLNEPLPDQSYASLCGPAAYFFCLINLSPTKYKLAVKQLWEKGLTKIGNLEIKPSLSGCRRVKNFYDGELPKIPPIDWITLASLRESENKAFQLKDPSQEVAGITAWWEMESWFKSSGFKILKTFPFYITGYNPTLIGEINKYAGPDYYIVTLISASLLNSGSSSGTQSLPDHWIVWTDKLKQPNGKAITSSTDPYKTDVKLKAFSWGVNTQVIKSKLSLYNFEKKVFFAMIIKKEIF
ncbi:hypothetical protein [Acinetobacter pittii]|uniref:hypothetical protein n=1 Tax=Acinetobacter pittii TaxID=48296 RepID=UPI001F439479|nr:hypothetical protein [Acinetobacter pittii]MCE6000088.1 hypothetical protein [Acinetobacter pittii]